MKLQSLKTGYIVLIFSLLLVGTVHAAINCPGTLPSGDQGLAYTYNFTGTNGTGANPWWVITAGSLPPGLTLNTQATNSVRLSGTPTAAGTYSVTITHHETGNPTCACTITINPTLTLSPANNTQVTPSAVRFVQYDSITIFTASGGSGIYTWSTPTALPNGLALSSTSGNNIDIQGTDTANRGTKTFQIRVTDSLGASVTYTYTIVIVRNGCDFSTENNENISFGNIDPTAGAGTIYGTLNTGVQLDCSQNTVCTITTTPAGGWSLSSGSNTMLYTLCTAPSGATYGTTPTNIFPVNCSNLTQPQYLNAPAGTYANTSAITVTVSWTSSGGGSLVATLPIGSVTATVMNVCSVNGSPALAFGALDAATNASGATATVTAPSIMCTMSDPVTVSNNGGLNYSGTPRMKSGTDYINYNFSSAGSLTGAGGTTDIGGSGAGHLALGATIPAGALDNVPAGTYNDTITLTISY
jgi:large repetitive protein